MGRRGAPLAVAAAERSASKTLGRRLLLRGQPRLSVRPPAVDTFERNWIAARANTAASRAQSGATGALLAATPTHCHSARDWLYNEPPALQCCAVALLVPAAIALSAGHRQPANTIALLVANAVATRERRRTVLRALADVRPQPIDSASGRSPVARSRDDSDGHCDALRCRSRRSCEL